MIINCVSDTSMIELSQGILSDFFINQFNSIVL